MGRIADRYSVSNEKYEARLALLKYVAGVNTALIAAALHGADKAVTLSGGDVLSPESAHALKWGVVFTLAAIGVCVTAIALNYHLHHGSIRRVSEHRANVDSLPSGLKRSMLGAWVRFESARSDFEVVLLILFVGTWWIAPCIAIVHYARAFSEILSA